MAIWPFRRRKLYRKVFAAGGVEETVDSSFNLNKALEREKKRAFIELCRELEMAGHLKITGKIKSGDYTKQYMTLEL